jgi:THO complex subunit 1
MVPAPDTFSGPIADDTFDMEMAKTDEDKELAANARHSKLWRTLRIASKSTGMLRRFDRIDDGHNLQALFEVPGDENAAKPAEADAGTKDPAQAPVSELSPPTGADPATVVEEGAS